MPPPRVLLGLAGLLVLSLLVVGGIVHAEVEGASTLHRLRLVLAAAPLLAAHLACFHPAVLAELRTWRPRRVAGLAAAATAWAFLLPAARLDPYALAIVAALAPVAVLAPRARLTPGRIDAVGLLVWLALWIPFDLRWYDDLWLAGEAGYAILALLGSLLAVLAFAVVGRLDTLGLRLPRGSDALWGLGVALAFAVVALPIGLATGFLDAGGPALGIGEAVAVALGLALTVALPEELFFRGLLDAGLRDHFRSPAASLAVSSLAFGLMHWNNAGSLGEQVTYVALASIAGVFYGLAFRRTGGLAGPVLTHTLVDLVWKAFLEA